MRTKVKGKGTSYKFLPEVQAALKKKKESTGKSFTQILEDLVLGRLQFSGSIEKLLNDEVRRTGNTRELIIEVAVINWLIRNLHQQSQGHCRLTHDFGSKIQADEELIQLKASYEDARERCLRAERLAKK
jgi:hypothetical protein